MFLENKNNRGLRNIDIIGLCVQQKRNIRKTDMEEEGGINELEFFIKKRNIIKMVEYHRNHLESLFNNIILNEKKSIKDNWYGYQEQINVLNKIESFGIYNILTYLIFDEKGSYNSRMKNILIFLEIENSFYFNFIQNILIEVILELRREFYD